MVVLGRRFVVRTEAIVLQAATFIRRFLIVIDWLRARTNGENFDFRLLEIRYLKMVLDTTGGGCRYSLYVVCILWNSLDDFPITSPSRCTAAILSRLTLSSDTTWRMEENFFPQNSRDSLVRDRVEFHKSNFVRIPCLVDWPRMSFSIAANSVMLMIIAFGHINDGEKEWDTLSRHADSDSFTRRRCWERFELFQRITLVGSQRLTLDLEYLDSNRSEMESF